MIRKVLSTLVAWFSAAGLVHAEITFAGGDGSSIERAIIVQGPVGEGDGVASEYRWVKENRPDATVIAQALIHDSGRVYDRLELEQNGKRIVLYFDITAFFGKY